MINATLYMLKVLFFLVFFLVFFIFNCDSQTVSSVEITALHSFWNSTGGTQWQWWNDTRSITIGPVVQNFTSGVSWNFSSPLEASTPCAPGDDRWEGIGCTESNDHITSIFLSHHALDGTLPDSICDLFALTALTLPFNSIHGEIPICISELTNLLKIDIAVNDLSGNLPDSLWRMTQLTWLNGFDNKFTGTLSANVGKLSNLVMLAVADNLMSGELPSELGKLHMVEYAPLGKNEFYGTIPLDLGNMTNLLHLGLLDCSFTKDIPSSISNVANLQSITLANNYLTGSFPSFLSEHSTLVNIQVFGNYLSGTLPSFGRNGYSALGVIQMQNNLFSGELTSTFSAAFSLSSVVNTLDLSENIFSGSVPSIIFKMPGLVNLALSSNCFSGTIPSTICECTNIISLSLDGLSSNNKCHNNGFLNFLFQDFVHGEFPSCAFKLPAISSLHISGNSFTGSIGEIGLRSPLTNISVSHNRFTGSLPISFIEQNLTLLDVSHNSMKGDINDISSVSDTLKANINRFSGVLSDDLSKMTFRELNILQGNIFDCANIPSEDENSANYSCGSKNLNIAIFLVFACLLLWVVMCVIVYLIQRVYVSARIRYNTVVESYFFFDKFGDVKLSSFNFLKFNTMLRKSVLYLSILSAAWITLCIPVFILKISYEATTYDNTYSWDLSLAYTSGIEASISVLVAWIILVVVGSVFFLRDLRFVEGNRESTVNCPREFESNDNVGIKEDFQVSSSKIQVSLCGYSLFLERKLYAIVLLFVNAIVVLGANGLYVYCIFLDLNERFTVSFQILFAVFMWVWRYAILSRFIINPAETISRRVMLRLWIHIFNNVISPILVLLVTDPDCFRGVFISADEITSTYQYLQCTLFLSDGTCGFRIPLSRTIHPFTPPFLYHYGCSSKLISTYVPVYLYSYFLYIMVIPLLFLVVSNCTEYENLPGLLRQMFPGILWPAYWVSHERDSVHSSTDVSSPLHRLEDSGQVQALRISTLPFLAIHPNMFRPDSVFGRIVEDMCIFLTFGLASPPLMLCTVASCVITFVMWKVSLGRFYSCFAKSGNALKHSDNGISVFLKNFENVIQQSLVLQKVEKLMTDVENSYQIISWPLFFCSSVFLCFLCFDMVASDSSSSQEARVSIPVTILCIPIFSRLCLVVWQKISVKMSA